MRTLNIGTNEHTEVIDVGMTGECHNYQVRAVHNHRPVAEIYFQNGPVKESGVNGCHNEDLIAVVVDRLKYFQAGEYACDENANALYYLAMALNSLRDRTNKRKARGVEGTHAV